MYILVENWYTLVNINVNFVATCVEKNQSQSQLVENKWKITDTFLPEVEKYSLQLMKLTAWVADHGFALIDLFSPISIHEVQPHNWIFTQSKSFEITNFKVKLWFCETFSSWICALCDSCTFTYTENFWWTPDFLQMMENLQFELWQNAKLGIKMLLFDLRPAMYEQTLEHV